MAGVRRRTGEILLRLWPEAAAVLHVCNDLLVEGVAVILLPFPPLDISALVVVAGGGELLGTHGYCGSVFGWA